ncbi:Alb1-domain-containing protein, partial [Massariosphaeria phaeospora]
MAKIAKAKKREVTVHSRAARRAASPSIDIDKSLKSKAPDSTSPARAAAKPKPHVLAAKSAGITKKSKSKPLKRQQRVRQLRAIDKAADTMDKMELKVQRSTGKDKKVRERKKGWEEVNGGKRKKGKNPFETLDGDEDEADATKREWVSDEDMPE